MLKRFTYKPGYSDMRGAHQETSLLLDESGTYRIIDRNREHFGLPTVVKTYAVSGDVDAFEAFLLRKIAPLRFRLKNSLFATDYSPWRLSADFAEENGKKPRIEEFSIGQYRIYTKKDMALLDEAKKRFESLRGELLSETAEEE